MGFRGSSERERPQNDRDPAPHGGTMPDVRCDLVATTASDTPGRSTDEQVARCARERPGERVLVSVKPMSNPILVVDSSEIREGKLEEVKAAVEDLVAFVEANAEPLAYNIYFDEAGMQMTVVQIHSRSESLEHHLTVAGPVFRRFADLVTLQRVDVYGLAGDAALEQLHGKAQLLGNAPVVVHALGSGFSHLAADSSAAEA